MDSADREDDDRAPCPVPVPPHRPQQPRGRVFRGTWAVRAGVLTEDQLRSQAWRRLRRDVYADADLPRTHRLAAVGVSVVAPTGAVYGGVTAAVLWGGETSADAQDPVEVVLPAGLRVAARAWCARADGPSGRRRGGPRPGPAAHRTGADVGRPRAPGDG